MKLLIDGLNQYYSDNVRLVKTLMKRESPEEFPELLKFALQMLYFDGNRWVEICRIDNYPHEGQNGSHIHYHDNVKRAELSYEEAKIAVKEISKRILKEKFSEVNHGL